MLGSTCTLVCDVDEMNGGRWVGGSREGPPSYIVDENECMDRNLLFAHLRFYDTTRLPFLLSCVYGVLP